MGQEKTDYYAIIPAKLVDKLVNGGGISVQIRGNSNHHIEISAKPVNSKKVTMKKYDFAIGSIQVKITIANKDLFDELPEENKAHFVEWMEHRKELKKPLRTKAMFKGQLKHFLDKSAELCKKAVFDGRENGWVNIKYAFERVEKNIGGKDMFPSKQNRKEF